MHGTQIATRAGRVVIERVAPQIDGGRFPIKRIVGEPVTVEADVFADGHDALGAAVLYRREDDASWTEASMTPLAGDRWQATFAVETLGRYAYTVQAWVDPFGTWARDLSRRVAAGHDVAPELVVGAALVEAAQARAVPADARRLAAAAGALRRGGGDATAAALDPDLAAVMARWAERRDLTTFDRELWVLVDRARARFSTWYELFPRSCAAEPGRHGTLADCQARLDYVAEMGFDVVYLPPIHPIGRTHRKGRNNAPTAGPDDPGSPWAIGAAEGGHDAVHPQLGTLDDVRRLVARARALGLEVALDLAFQCSPDHPYVTEHPEWFRWRADGRVQFAENPPKRYEDIFPLYFEGDAWASLWEELRRVVAFWIKQDVRIFRVDNPHTKPFRFWEWLLAAIRAEHPDVLFLSEAFTRPAVMYHLAKLGFTQSYTYFAWRNTKWELERYFTELTRTEVVEFFRPNLWPNTPDILTEYLQTGGRPAFVARLVLAATLGASYGIYGPPFELCEARPREPGSEEYLHSEKYEIRHWELDRAESLRHLVARVNRIRRENPALQDDRSLAFHSVDTDALIAYSKRTADLSNVILAVVNLDPHHRQAGWVTLPLEALGLSPHEPYQVHDLLTGMRFLWSGARNYVELDPQRLPAHIFRVRRQVRKEHDFEYYL
jgi:starch synthase (maltosyl-transferring)